jgi:hypothetical protein
VTLCTARFAKTHTLGPLSTTSILNLDSLSQRQPSHRYASIKPKNSHALTLPVAMAKTKATKAAGKSRSAIADVVSREYTIHLHKRVRP